MKEFIRIDPRSQVPKYSQIVAAIIDDVLRRKLKEGERIPSINDLSEQYDVSRDTVEKAYGLLRKKGVIESKKRRGFFIAKPSLKVRPKVLLMLNKFSDYELKVFNTLVTSLNKDVQVDFFVYHYDVDLFVNHILSCAGRYDYYLIMPHFKDHCLRHQSGNKKIDWVLNKIPREKIGFLDNLIPGWEGHWDAVVQDFKTDISAALKQTIEKLRKYKKIVLVFPDNLPYPYPEEIKTGFRKFCLDFQFDFEVVDVPHPAIEEGTAYVIIEEKDLVRINGLAKKRNIRPGNGIGIISYNDSPLKKMSGISVITTDVRQMGESGASLINSPDFNRATCKNPFHFIERESL
ncbi:GntR family transcriptional regulator [Echinicola soli]|nr:winged helix-turn-helix domain-containing protein [Echinicola soli]